MRSQVVEGSVCFSPEGVPKGSQLPDGSYQISATGPMYRAAANVTMRIYDDAGTLLQTAPINLGSSRHTSFMLPTNYSVTANKRRMAEFVVPPGTKISAIGLRAKNDGTLTTTPVVTK
jgi:flagellar hook assembly protein FlgD